MNKPVRYNFKEVIKFTYTSHINYVHDVSWVIDKIKNDQLEA